MTNQHPGRGGARKGAGRPKVAEEVKRRRVDITLDPATVEWITAQRQRPNEPISQVIERVLNSLRIASD